MRKRYGGPGGVRVVGHDALEGRAIVVDVRGVAHHRERGGVAVAAVEAHYRAAQLTEVRAEGLALRGVVDVVAAQARHGEAHAIGEARDRARAEVECDLAAQLDGSSVRGGEATGRELDVLEIVGEHDLAGRLGARVRRRARGPARGARRRPAR